MLIAIDRCLELWQLPTHNDAAHRRVTGTRQVIQDAYPPIQPRTSVDLTSDDTILKSLHPDVARATTLQHYFTFPLKPYLRLSHQTHGPHDTITATLTCDWQCSRRPQRNSRPYPCLPTLRHPSWRALLPVRSCGRRGCLAGACAASDGECKTRKPRRQPPAVEAPVD